MPVDGSGTNPGAFDREKKTKQCHFNLCISQLYKTFGTINAKLIKKNKPTQFLTFLYIF